jgi:hypothetical protein
MVTSCLQVLNRPGTARSPQNDKRRRRGRLGVGRITLPTPAKHDNDLGGGEGGGRGGRGGGRGEERVLGWCGGDDSGGTGDGAKNILMGARNGTGMRMLHIQRHARPIAFLPFGHVTTEPTTRHGNGKPPVIPNRTSSS